MFNVPGLKLTSPAAAENGREREIKHAQAESKEREKGLWLVNIEYLKLFHN